MPKAYMTRSVANNLQVDRNTSIYWNWKTLYNIFWSYLPN